MKNNLGINANLVFSTKEGRLCPDCARAADDCICKQQKNVIGDGIIRVTRQTKGRKGKGVSIITGLALPENEIKELASKLKNICGCGGTVKDGNIEIQGDQRDKIIEHLNKMGFNAKKAGG